MSTTRIEVVRGGDPGPEVLAALVIGLTPVATTSPDGDGGRARDPRANWTRAALVEGVGGPITLAAEDGRSAWVSPPPR